MANKRILKKQVRYICGDLAAECILASKTISNIDNEKMYGIIYDVAELQTNTLQRASFGFDKSAKDFGSNREYKKARKKYYKLAFNTMAKDFNEKVADIVKKMNAQLPQAKKEANKKVTDTTKKAATKTTTKKATTKTTTKKATTKTTTKKATTKTTTKKATTKKATKAAEE